MSSTDLRQAAPSWCTTSAPVTTWPSSYRPSGEEAVREALCDLYLVKTGDLGVDVEVVLAHVRGGGQVRLEGGATPDRRVAVVGSRAERRVGERPPHLPSVELRVPPEVRTVLDPPRRHARGLQRLLRGLGLY